VTQRLLRLAVPKGQPSEGRQRVGAAVLLVGLEAAGRRRPAHALLERGHVRSKERAEETEVDPVPGPADAFVHQDQRVVRPVECNRPLRQPQEDLRGERRERLLHAPPHAIEAIQARGKRLFREHFLSDQRQLLANGLVLEVEVVTSRIQVGMQDGAVALGLVSLLDHPRRVAEVAHHDGAECGGASTVPNQLGDRRRHLLVHGESVTDFGPVSKQPRGSEAARLATAVLVDERQLQRKKRRIVELTLDRLRIPFLHHLVRIQDQDPVVRRLIQGTIPGRREIAGPFQPRDLGSSGRGQAHRPVRRPGVHDDDLVDEPFDGVETPTQA